MLGVESDMAAGIGRLDQCGEDLCRLVLLFRGMIYMQGNRPASG